MSDTRELWLVHKDGVLRLYPDTQAGKSDALDYAIERQVMPRKIEIKQEIVLNGSRE